MTPYRRVAGIDGNPCPDMILREDGASIPADPRNADWQAYQAWLEAGNTPVEPVPGTQPSKDRPSE